MAEEKKGEVPDEHHEQFYWKRRRGTRGRKRQGKAPEPIPRPVIVRDIVALDINSVLPPPPLLPLPVVPPPPPAERKHAQVVEDEPVLVERKHVILDPVVVLQAEPAAQRVLMAPAVPELPAAKRVAHAKVLRQTLHDSQQDSKRTVSSAALQNIDIRLYPLVAKFAIDQVPTSFDYVPHELLLGNMDLRTWRVMPSAQSVWDMVQDAKLPPGTVVVDVNPRYGASTVAFLSAGLPVFAALHKGPRDSQYDRIQSYVRHVRVITDLRSETVLAAVGNAPHVLLFQTLDWNENLEASISDTLMAVAQAQLGRVTLAFNLPPAVEAQQNMRKLMGALPIHNDHLASLQQLEAKVNELKRGISGRVRAEPHAMPSGLTYWAPARAQQQGEMKGVLPDRTIADNVPIPSHEDAPRVRGTKTYLEAVAQKDERVTRKIYESPHGDQGLPLYWLRYQQAFGFLDAARCLFASATKEDPVAVLCKNVGYQFVCATMGVFNKAIYADARESIETPDYRNWSQWLLADRVLAITSSDNVTRMYPGVVYYRDPNGVEQHVWMALIAGERASPGQLIQLTNGDGILNPQPLYAHIPFALGRKASERDITDRLSLQLTNVRTVLEQRAAATQPTIITIGARNVPLFGSLVKTSQADFIEKEVIAPLRDCTVVRLKQGKYTMFYITRGIFAPRIGAAQQALNQEARTIFGPVRGKTDVILYPAH